MHEHVDGTLKVRGRRVCVCVGKKVTSEEAQGVLTQPLTRAARHVLSAYNVLNLTDVYSL